MSKKVSLFALSRPQNRYLPVSSPEKKYTSLIVSIGIRPPFLSFRRAGVFAPWDNSKNVFTGNHGNKKFRRTSVIEVLRNFFTF